MAGKTPNKTKYTMILSLSSFQDFNVFYLLSPVCEYLWHQTTQNLFTPFSCSLLYPCHTQFYWFTFSQKSLFPITSTCRAKLANAILSHAISAGKQITCGTKSLGYHCSSIKHTFLPTSAEPQSTKGLPLYSLHILENEIITSLLQHSSMYAFYTSAHLISCAIISIKSFTEYSPRLPLAFQPFPLLSPKINM